jgi:Domain of unknown function (DUF4252)
MKKIALAVACAVLTLPGAAFAQNITIPERIEKLSGSAKESVNITLDGPLLQLAGVFLNSNDKDQAAAKSIISKLKSINVRTFEFEKHGMYSDADLDAIRAQLKAPQWARVVDSKERDEHTQIFVKLDKNVIAGVVILSAESRELSIVSIDGQIDLNQLSKLGGHFGVPKIDAPGGSAKDSAE